MDPIGGLFKGKLISLIWAYLQVEELLKSSYEDNDIDIPTKYGKNYLEECVNSMVQSYKQDISYWMVQNL